MRSFQYLVKPLESLLSEFWSEISSPIFDKLHKERQQRPSKKIKFYTFTHLKSLDCNLRRKENPYQRFKGYSLILHFF